MGDREVQQVESKQVPESPTGVLVKNESDHTIHTDLIGPFRIPSIGKYIYVLTMIAEKGRYVTADLLKSKKDVDVSTLFFISCF